MRTETIEIYQFNELSDDAKEKARDWFRACLDANDYSDTIDDFIEVARILGVDVTRRAVYWSGFCSQGDGACFEGSYRYKRGAAKAIRAYAPKDTELHQIADELQAVQKRNFYRLSATMSHRGRYYHSGCMSVNAYNSHDTWCDLNDSSEDEIIRLMRLLADWLYSKLDAQNDHLNSDESIDSSILANEYEFYADGKRA